MIDIDGPHLRTLEILGECARRAFELFGADQIAVELRLTLKEPERWKENAERAWLMCRHAEQYIAATK